MKKYDELSEVWSDICEIDDFSKCRDFLRDKSRVEILDVNSIDGE